MTKRDQAPASSPPSPDRLTDAPPDSHGLTRRQVVQAGVGGVLGSLLWPGADSDARPRIKPSKVPDLSAIEDVGSMIQSTGWRRPGQVVSVVSDSAFPLVSSAPNDAVVKTMVNTILMKLSGKATADKAWGSLFGPGDRVGILIDERGNGRTRTRKATIDAVLAGLQSAGVSPNQIILWSQYGRFLPHLGYALNIRGKGLKVAGADQVGFDKRHGIKSKRGMFGSVRGFSRIVTALCSHVINIATLEDHPIIGARLCLAQQAIASLQGGAFLERRWGGLGIAQIAGQPMLRQRFVLHFIDGLAGSYSGGAHAWHPEVILGGTDPVALDRIGFGLIESERQRGGKPLISGTRRTPRYINNAASIGLGVANLMRIRHQQIRLK